MRLGKKAPLGVSSCTTKQAYTHFGNTNWYTSMTLRSMVTRRPAQASDVLQDVAHGGLVLTGRLLGHPAVQYRGVAGKAWGVKHRREHAALLCFPALRMQPCLARPVVGTGHLDPLTAICVW